MEYKAYFDDEETSCDFVDNIRNCGWTVNGNYYDSEKRLYVVRYTKF